MVHVRRLCCVLLVMSLLTGCSKWQVLTTLGLGAAAGAGIAAVYYVKGDLEADVKHDIGRSYRASLAAMDMRNYEVTDKDVNSSSGRIKAVIPAGGGEKKRNLVIKLERIEKKLTRVSIRVGIFGNESLSRAILRDIESRL